MIRRLLLTLFLVLGFAFIEAQNSSLFLSYCDGKLAEAGASRQGVSVTVSAAVGFPADGLVQFAGAELTTLRIGLCTVNADMSGLTAWVRSSLTGEVISEVALESFQSGWNEVKLPTPISIDGKQDLYLGTPKGPGSDATASGKIGALANSVRSASKASSKAKACRNIISACSI